MKLRNKKTGEIVERYIIETASAIGIGLILQDNDTNKHYQYNSLAELNEEWEDYEEPKEWWYIDIHGPHKVTNNDEYYQQVKVASKEIGNYFETEEEAEKAVKKLKAWKRLNNCGLKFIDWWLSKDNHIIIGTNRQIFDIDEQGLREDLALLFGGGDGNVKGGKE